MQLRFRAFDLADFLRLKQNINSTKKKKIL